MPDWLINSLAVIGAISLGGVLLTCAMAYLMARGTDRAGE